jgi:hypothetical protein
MSPNGMFGVRYRVVVDTALSGVIGSCAEIGHDRRGAETQKWPARGWFRLEIDDGDAPRNAMLPNLSQHASPD